MGILYQLTFASGKKYIGVTESDSMNLRFSQHRYKAKTGSKLPVHLAWIKYGEPEILVLRKIESSFLYQAEIDEIAKQNTIAPNGYNILEGGQKSPALNKDVAKKISNAQLKRYENPEERKKISERHRNRSEETRKKISVALTGKKLSEETKQKLREANLGKKHNFLTKEKMSKTHTGKKYSEKTLQRMREAAQKRMKSPQAKAQLKAASLKGGNSMKLKAKKKL